MDDRQLILDLGGPTKVAVMLGLDKTKGGPQRVQNWMTRGIPAKVKLQRPDLFLPDLVKQPEPLASVPPCQESSNPLEGVHA